MNPMSPDQARKENAAPADSAVARIVERAIAVAIRHWLLGINAMIAFYVTAITLAPLLVAEGHGSAARPIYFMFQFLCHQHPDRSFHIAGEQMAVCERCIAIYSAMLLAGLIFALLRSRLRPLSPRLLGLLAAPMAIDGLTQLSGLRESAWEPRVLTGTLFGLGVCWLVLPHLERGFAEPARAQH